MALDSDDQNPDAALWVKFEHATRHNTFKSAQEGRPIYEDCVRIKIAIPNNPTLIIEREIEESDKARFPVQWAHFVNSQGASDSQGGTPIEHLTFLSKAVIENLKVAKFYSVEQLANASDSALLGAGMAFGMQPLTLRERAIRFLESARENAGTTRLEAELEKRDAEIETLKGQMQQLIELAQRKAEPEPDTEKRGPGRPRKEASEAA